MLWSELRPHVACPTAGQKDQTNLAFDEYQTPALLLARHTMRLAGHITSQALADLS